MTTNALVWKLKQKRLRLHCIRVLFMNLHISYIVFFSNWFLSIFFSVAYFEFCGVLLEYIICKFPVFGRDQSRKRLSSHTPKTIVTSSCSCTEYLFIFHIFRKLCQLEFLCNGDNCQSKLLKLLFFWGISNTIPCKSQT